MKPSRVEIGEWIGGGVDVRWRRSATTHDNRRAGERGEGAPGRATVRQKTEPSGLGTAGRFCLEKALIAAVRRTLARELRRASSTSTMLADRPRPAQDRRPQSDGTSTLRKDLGGRRDGAPPRDDLRSDTMANHRLGDVAAGRSRLQARWRMVGAGQGQHEEIPLRTSTTAVSMKSPWRGHLPSYPVN